MKSCAMILLVILLILAGCSESVDQEGQIVAMVNNSSITDVKFNRLLKKEIDIERGIRVTNDTKRKFLDSLIEKEVLIQVAQREKLDSTDEFVEAIEKYWESTLIKNLIEKKSREIMEQIVITEEEIKTGYEQLILTNPDIGNFQDSYDEMKSVLLNEKMSYQLKTWIKKQVEGTEIDINETLLTDSRE